MKRRVLKKVLAIVLTLAMIFPSAVSLKNVDVKAATQEDEIPEGYIPIYDISDLYAIRNDLDGMYILMNDIDMAENTELYDTGNGWVPINGFSGIMDGNGHYIKNMKIYGDVRYAGLFGHTDYSFTIENLGMLNVDIDVTGNTASAAIVAYIDYGVDNAEIKNCFVRMFLVRKN